MDVLYWLVFFLKYEFRFANTDVRVWKSNYYRPPDYNTQKALLEQYLSTSSNVERAAYLPGSMSWDRVYVG